MGPASELDCVIREVCGWLSEKAELPVWGKKTVKVTNITQMEKKDSWNG